MFYTASNEQVEQLYPDILTTDPGKMRIYYTHEDGTKRMVDRCHGYCFSDKPWGLDQEYLTEGIDQEFVDDKDYLSLNIRNSIKAPDGWTFVSCDYAAEELRLGALNTKGKLFLDAFRHNKDPHLNTAIMMFGEKAVKENKKKYRSLAKGCNSVDALYATEDGYKHLNETDHILDLNGNKQKFGYVVEHRLGHRVLFSNGKDLLVTDNHKFFDLDSNSYTTHHLGMRTKYIDDVDEFIKTGKYTEVTIVKIVPEYGDFNIMECETHYYIAEGFAQPNCNFGLQYGGSWRVVQTEEMSPEEAQQIYDSYMLAQADHFAVQRAQVKKTHQTLTEYTFFGLPVRLHNYYNSDNPSMVNAGERLAKNHRIQGTGSDVLSIGYMKLWKNIFGKIPHIEDFIRFQITVHDEIDFIIRNDVLDILVPEVLKCMQLQMPDWEIPLTIGLSLGPTFGTQYEWVYNPKTLKMIGPDMNPVIKKEEPKQQVQEVTEEEEQITLDI